MSLLENAKRAAIELKTALYQLGGAFSDLKKADSIVELPGLRFTDCCKSECKMDMPMVNLGMKVAERFPLDQLLDLPISAWKGLVSDKEPKEPSKDKYLTIKLDHNQEAVFNSAYGKFCAENGLDPATSRSYFVETRCAEYLAEVTIDGVVEDFPIEANYVQHTQV